MDWMPVPVLRDDYTSDVELYHTSTAPYNDKPPDYYDIYPGTTVLPLPVISPPANAPTVHTTTSTGTPYADNFTATTSTTGHAHSRDQNKGFGCHVWTILFMLSCPAAILFPPTGIQACVWIHIGLFSEDEGFQKIAVITATILCVISYAVIIVAGIIIAITVSIAS